MGNQFKICKMKNILVGNEIISLKRKKMDEGKDREKKNDRIKRKNPEKVVEKEKGKERRKQG